MEKSWAYRQSTTNQIGLLHAKREAASMGIEATNHDDMAPHGVIIDIRWEVHQRLADGKYAGHAKDTGRTVFDLKGDNRALANEYIKALLDLIREKATNVSELEVKQDRLRELQVPRISEPREPRSRMLGMRGGISRNNSS
jgi:hypothetical protein